MQECDFCVFDSNDGLMRGSDRGTPENRVKSVIPICLKRAVMDSFLTGLL